MIEELSFINRRPNVYVVTEKLTIRQNAKFNVAQCIFRFELLVHGPYCHALTIADVVANTLLKVALSAPWRMCK